MMKKILVAVLTLSVLSGIFVMDGSVPPSPAAITTVSQTV